MFFLSHSLCENIFNFCETLFLFTSKKTSFSLFPFLLGFFTLIYFSMFGLFLCLEKWFLVFITRLFFASSFQLCFSFFSFLMYAKIRMSLLWWNVGKTLFCFLFLFSWFKNIFWAKKSVLFSTVLEITFKILFSLQEKPPKKNSAQKKPSFFVFVQPFFCFTCFLSTFFLSFYHHCFLCSLFPFIFLFISFCFSLLFLFSLFSILSLFLHLSVSPSLFLSVSHVSFFFSIAVFVNLLFVLPHFSSVSFVLDLIFLFILILYLFFFFHHLRIFLPEKNQKFLWSILLDEIVSLFFEPSLLRCFISCFFPPCVVLIPCLFHFLLILDVYSPCF